MFNRSMFRTWCTLIAEPSYWNTTSKVMRPVIGSSKMGLMPTLKTVGIFSTYRHLPFATEVFSTVIPKEVKANKNVNELAGLMNGSIRPQINVKTK